MISSIVDFANNSLASIGNATDVLSRTMADKLAGIHDTLSAIPAISAELNKVVSKLSGMEAKIITQNSQLKELLRVNRSLVEENSALSMRISSLENKLSTLEDYHRAHTDLVTAQGDDMSIHLPLPPPPAPCGSGADEAVRANYLDPNSEVIVAGAINTNAPESSYGDIAVAVLSSLVPSLKSEDIAEVRALRPHSPVVRNGVIVGVSNDSDLGNSSHGRLYLRIRLGRSDVKNSILRVRREFNYFTGSDVVPSLLPQESQAHLLKGKICINEALKPEKYKRFLSLKRVARGLGFKYIWHSRGNFLVRRRGGDRAYTFNTASDLDAIARALSGDKRKSPQIPRSPGGHSGKHSE